MEYAKLSADGEFTHIEGKPSLDDMQAIVGGYVQAISVKRDGEFGPVAVMWLNEEGKLQDPPLRVNQQATRLAHASRAITYSDDIRGDVLFTGPADDEGEVTTLDQQWLSWLADLPPVHVSESV